MISPDPTTMNPSSARPSFNGAANGAPSYASSLSNGGSGRSTPTFVLGGSSSTSFELVPAEQLASSSSRAKPKNGREIGALAYSAAEHQALLALLQAMPTAFNGGESAPEWKEEIYKKMVDGFYRDLGVVPRQSVTLYGHFIELYSAFKQAIRALSTTKGAAKCPSEFSNGAQNASWLEGKAVEHRGKFDTDQKNRENELTWKHAVEEEERLEAAKNRKMVADPPLNLWCSWKEWLPHLTPI